MLRLLDLLPHRADRAGLRERAGAWCLVGVIESENGGWSYRTNASVLVGGNRSVSLGDAVLPLRKRRGDGPFAATILVGRAASTDVVIEHPSVSKLHARIEQRPDGSLHLSDAGSSNGTTVDGANVGASAVVVVDGAEVGFGACTFRLCNADSVARMLARLVRAGEAL